MRIKGLVENIYLSDLFEKISFFIVCIFSFLPLCAVFKPSNHSLYFINFSVLSILLFFTSLFFCLVVLCIRKTIINKLKGIFTKLKENKDFAFLLIVFILAFVSSIFATNKERAFWGTDFRPDGMFMLLTFLIIFICGRYIKKNQYRNIILMIYIVSFIILSFVMINQYYGVLGSANASKCPSFLKPVALFYEKLSVRYGHFYKGTTASFYNLNHMGYYICICSSMFVGMFFNENKMSKKIALCFLVALSFWTLILNDTLGAFIAVFVSVLIFTFVMIFVRKTKVRVAIIPLVIFALVNVLCVSFPFEEKSIIEKNITETVSDVKKVTSNKNDEVKKVGSARGALWIASFDMIKEKPLLGHGIDNLKSEYSKRGAKGDRAHNEFLERAVSTGIPSAIFYLLAILWNIKTNLKKKNILSESVNNLPFIMATVSYFVSSFVGVFLFYTACHFMVVLSLGKKW